jgi:hypothetical protein
MSSLAPHISLIKGKTHNLQFVSVKNKTIPNSRLLTEISERPELLSEKNPVTIRKKHEKTW